MRSMGLLKLVAIVSVLFSPIARAGSTLTCNEYPGQGVVPLSQTFTGTWTNAKVTVDTHRGFIPTELSIGWNGGNSLQILEARDPAGGSWQTAYMGLDGGSNNIWVGNQAAGDMLDGQWGYAASWMNYLGSNLMQSDWSPIYTDHYHPNADWSTSVPTSPCPGAGNAARFHDGQVAYYSTMSPTSQGNVVSLHNIFSLRDTQGWQGFTWFDVDQGIYLLRQPLGYNNGRATVAFHDGSKVTFYPQESYQGIANSTCDWTRPSYTCSMDFVANSRWLDYITFVYNVGGSDIGVAIHRPDNTPFAGTLELQLNALVDCPAVTNFAAQDPSGCCCNSTNGCSNAAAVPYVCGNVSWHSLVADSQHTAPGRAPDPHTFGAGQIIQYHMQYDVGGYGQLLDLGKAW